MNMILIILSIYILLFIIGFYLLRYLNGYYTIKSSEIIQEGDITRNDNKEIIGKYYYIKTIYKNNRIIIKKKEFI